MKKILLFSLLFFAFIFHGFAQEDAFITTWKTDNSGPSADNQINIPTYSGETYNYNINWGDGTSNTMVLGNISHTYSVPGTYQVEISGLFPGISFSNSFFSDNSANDDKEKIISIDQWGTNQWALMEFAFNNCVNLDVLANDIPNLSNVNSTKSMFRSCRALVGNSTFSEWDVSGVTDFSEMFGEAEIFNQDISDWNVSSGNTMYRMFYGAYNFNQNISNWDVTNVTRFEGMFSGIRFTNQRYTSFNQDIGSWNVSKGENFDSMFSNSNFNQDLSEWNMSNAINISDMFEYARYFNQNLGDWNVSNVVNFGFIFGLSNTSVENYDTTLIGWSQLPVLQSDIIITNSQIGYCESTDARQKLTDDYNWTFRNDYLACSGSTPLISTWKTDNEGSSQDNQVAIEYRNIGPYTIDWGDGNIDEEVESTLTHTYATPGTYQISISGAYTVITFGNSGDRRKLLSVDQWGDTKWSTTSTAFMKCDNVKILANDTPDLSNVTSMRNMFDRAFSVTGNFQNWDVSNVSDFNGMFNRATSFNEDISNWDVRNGSDFAAMFFGATAFNQNLGGWSLGSVNYIYDMLTDTGLSTSNYDATLEGWSQQPNLNTNVTFAAVNVEYCQAEEARQKLIDDFGWSITDGGMATDCSVEPEGRPFITVWKTDNPGNSADNQITIPTFQGETYNYSVDWGDGTSDASVTGDIIHSYAVPGTYEVSITGVFPRINFAFRGDADTAKILFVNQWGDIKWNSMNSAFSGCNRLDVLAIDTPDLSNVTDMSSMFSFCSSLVGNESFSNWNTSSVTDMNNMFNFADFFNHNIAAWDTSSVTNMLGMFNYAIAFNQDLGDWNTSSVLNMFGMFRSAKDFDQDLSRWNVSNVQNMTEMFFNAAALAEGYDGSLTGLSTENYDTTLIGWSAQQLQNGVSFNGGDSEYCLSEDARQSLIDVFGWTITDGGKAADCAGPVLTCPTSQVVLTTQQEVDAFSSTYDVANCTFDEGIEIEGADITNLNGLSGLATVNGDLKISSNPVLTDMSGLSTLSTVNGNLTISSNASLENLSGLSSLTSAGGNMLINRNAVLTDLNGLSALAFVSRGLNISKNPILSNCEIALICDATVVTGDSNIYQNTGECADLATAEAACSSEPEGKPIVDAGENQVIVLLATSSATFNGTASDPDGGTIVSFEWTQIEGPDTAMLMGENTATLEVTGLITGSYLFRLTVINDQDETGFDEVALEVQSGGSSSPIVNAGQDQNSTESSIILTGSGSDPDGGDVVFLWTQENGPSTATLSGSDTAELIATNLIVGDYSFKLTVTDDENETAFDEVTVTITVENPVLTCPSNEVLLSTQQELDAFATTFDLVNCTFDGGIRIEGTDITNLNGLSGLTIVNGDLKISNNPVLTDMSGLSALTTVNGNLTISSNASLENLSGLSSFTSAGGNMLINRNAVLTDLNGLSALAYVSRGLNISKNPILSNCEIALICDATVVTGDSNIYQNTGDCADLAAAEAACTMEPEGRPFVTTWKTDNFGTSEDNQITIPTLARFSGYTYDYAIDWGDGTLDTSVTDDITHTYENPGIYEVSIVGKFPHLYFGNEGEKDKEKLLQVNQWGSIEWLSMKYSFYGCSNMDVVATDIPDFSRVSDLTFMFGDCTSLVGNESIGQWNMSKIKKLDLVFINAEAFNIDISNWDLGSAETTSAMFLGASSFNQNIGSWNVSQVQNMGGMFSGALSFNQDIGNWNVENVEEMSAMFYSCDSFNQDISNWNVIGVKKMNSMFSEASNFNQNLSTWNVSNVIEMNAMFFQAQNFNQNLGDWNVSQVSDMGLILNTTNLSIDNYDAILNGWSTQQLQNGVTFDGGNSQYCQAEEARQKLIDNFGWTITDDGKAENCEVAAQRPFITTWIMENDNPITIPTFVGEDYDYEINWGDGTSDTGVTGNITHSYAVPGTYQVSITGDFPRIYFYSSDNKRNLQSIDQWGDIEWTSMESAFYGTGLIYQALDTPDLSNVTSLADMFHDCYEFTGNETINSWNTSTIINMSSMFEFSDFNQNLDKWNVSNVTDMESIFSATYFNYNIDAWDVSKVQNMSNMFSETRFNQNIGSWDVSNVTNMNGMFFFAIDFNQNLGSWNVSQVSNMNGMFETTKLSIENYDNILIGWSSQQIQNGVAFENDNIEYCRGENARQKLIDDFGWLINDGGKAEDCDDPVLTCPTVQIVLATQQEVDAFATTYDVANCTFDQGISIEGADITNLNGLSGLTTVNGDLRISNNPVLTDMSGLSALSTLGKNLSFSSNASLENFNGLALLTTVSGNILINRNAVLTDLNGLSALTYVSRGLNISKNPVLSNCKIALICDATVVTGDSNIYQNTGDCADLATAEAACSSQPEQRPFVTTWKTDNPGISNNNQITIPAISWESYEYDYNVDWGDGTTDIGVTGVIMHTYDNPGTYQVSITGDLPKISFNPNPEGGDRDKLISVDQWGDIEWKTMSNAFYRCENLDVVALDIPDLSNVEDLYAMFAFCESLVGNSAFSSWDVSQVNDMMVMFVGTPFNQDISYWDVQNVSDMSFMFQGASFNQDISRWDVSGVTTMAGMFNNSKAFNQDLSEWNVSNVTNMSGMFHSSKAFNQDISEWNISNVTSMSIMFWKSEAFDQNLSAWDVSNLTTLQDIFSDSNLSPENYDKVLQGWSQLPTLQNNVKLGAQNINYCQGEEARQKLIDDFGWIITDSGKALNCDAGLTGKSTSVSNNSILSPNPATNTTSLSFENPVEMKTIQVFDVLGRLVTTYEGPELNDDGAYLLNVKFISAGTYFIKSHDVDGNQYQKQMVIIK